MPPSALLRPQAFAAVPRVPPAWQRPLTTLALAWALLIGLFAGDWRAMAGQWWDASTYNHVLLVPIILIWLVALRWPQVAKLTPAAWWPGRSDRALERLAEAPARVDP